jgi:hypothetical protein
VTTTQPTPTCEHKQRRVYAKGVCRNCYLAQWRIDYKKAHPEWKPPVSPNRDKAVAKYNNSPKGKLTHLKHELKQQRAKLGDKPSLSDKKAMTAKLLKAIDPAKIASLSKAAIRLLETKYGVNNMPLRPLKDLIAELGISRQRIHQIEQDTLKALLGKV